MKCVMGKSQKIKNGLGVITAVYIPFTCRRFLNKLIGETRILIFLEYCFLPICSLQKINQNPVLFTSVGKKVTSSSLLFNLEDKGRHLFLFFVFFFLSGGSSVKTSSSRYLPVFQQCFDNLATKLKQHLSCIRNIAFFFNWPVSSFNLFAWLRDHQMVQVFAFPFSSLCR